MSKNSSSWMKPVYGLVLVIVMATALLCAGCTSQSETSTATNATETSTPGQASVGDLVSLDYIGTLDDGTVFDSSENRSPFQFILGSGNAIEGFDNGIRGMKVGEVKKFNVQSEQAYGEYDPTRIQVFPIDFIPEGENVSIGDSITLFNGQAYYQSKIIALNETNVTFDLNSPLAGKDLNFEVTLVELIPADQVESYLSQLEAEQNTTA